MLVTIGFGGAVPLPYLALISIRINPCMALHAALMTLLYAVRQRIVPGVKAAVRNKVGRPRLIARVIHRIASRTHLKTYRIHIIARQRIKQRRQLLLLRIDLRRIARRRYCRLRPVQLPDGGHPRRAHLTHHRRVCRIGFRACVTAYH